MSRTVRLKFAPQYREAILEGAKRATIRYGLDRPMAPGDYLHLLTPAGDWFASAVVERVDQMTLFDAATTDIDGHRSYANVHELIGQLRGFYPKATLTPNTDLTVVAWEGAHAPLDCENHHGPGECCLLPEPKDRTGYQKAGYPR